MTQTQGDVTPSSVNDNGKVSERQIAQRISFGVDLPTTFAATLKGLVEDTGPTNVALSLYESDWETTTVPTDYVLHAVLSADELGKLTRSPTEDMDDEAYLVIFPYDDEISGREIGSMPQLIQTSRVAHLHVH